MSTPELIALCMYIFIAGSCYSLGLRATNSIGFSFIFAMIWPVSLLFATGAFLFGLIYNAVTKK